MWGGEFMVSCDSYVTSTLLEGISVDEIILAHGLANSLYEARYANQNIYLMNGRLNYKYGDLLDCMNIDYIKLDSACLLNEDMIIKGRRIVLTLPTNFMGRIHLINEKVKQIGLIYSTYIVDEIKENTIYLYTMVDDKEIEKKKICFGDYKKLLSIKMAFCEEPVYVYEILGTTRFNHIVLRNNVKIGAQSCITNKRLDTKQGSILYRGRYGYQKLLEVIEKFDDFNKVEKMIFVQSICGGSMFFHRREYAEALLHVFGEEYNNISSCLIHSGNSWRKLGRKILGAIKTDSELKYKEIKEIIKRIEELEFEAFRCLEEKIL